MEILLSILLGEKNTYTFQVWSGLKLDTKNSMILVLDCKNCIMYMYCNCSALLSLIVHKAGLSVSFGLSAIRKYSCSVLGRCCVWLDPLLGTASWSIFSGVRYLQLWPVDLIHTRWIQWGLDYDYFLWLIFDEKIIQVYTFVISINNLLIDNILYYS